VSAYDVAVVGAGIIGSSVAFRLAEEKLRVVLLDRQQPGREASWAAAGMLAPGPEPQESPALVPLAIASFHLYPEFVSAVEEASARSTGFLREGALHVFPGPNGEAHREKFVEDYRRFNLPIEPISMEGARKLEKSLGPAAGVAAWIPEEAVVDPRLLTDAVLEGARNRGVEIRPGAPVTAILHDGTRCYGVLAAGERLAAKQVIIAGGAFCRELDWLVRYAPTRPVRGQMLALQKSNLQLRIVLRSEKGYLVPRSDGRIIAGSTLEEAGFAKHLTPDGMLKILSAVLELVPSLADAQIIETWAGLRPGTPDGLPILGPTDIEGLFIATGHYRNGILLAAITARLLHDWILCKALSLDAGSYSPQRFARESSHTRSAKSAFSRT
jgi:glycine oxidase